MEPDSAIVNIYEVDDCIPPHIDHHDFSRPFCTISLLSEEKIMFGSKLVPASAGVFHGVNDMHFNIKLPLGKPFPAAALAFLAGSAVQLGNLCCILVECCDLCRLCPKVQKLCSPAISSLRKFGRFLS